MSIAMSSFDFFIVLFLSALCRRTARLNASHRKQCANAHIRNRRCLARLPTTPGPRLRAQARGESPPLTFQIGGRGSRHPRPLPDRPPTLQAFRSVLRVTPSVSTQRPSRLPFLPPSPRSSIPESTRMIPQNFVRRLSAITIQPQLDRITSTVSQGSDPRHPSDEKR